MAATADLDFVLTAAHRVGARVLLVGDHHQLPEINAGGVFAAAVARRHGDVAELRVNRRQQAVWEHEALDHLRHGRPLEGLRAYIDHGHVHLTATPTEVHTHAVGDWVAAHRAGVDAILLAGTVAEARRLNHLARLSVADELTGPALTCRGRRFQVGDRVVLLRNQGETFGHVDVDTGRACRVDNGMIGTIHHIDAEARITVMLKAGRRIRLTAAYAEAGFVDHGYATTIHKAQGVTCDRVFLVGPAGLYREAVYVAMSRARHASHLYATSTQLSELVEASHATGIPLPDEHLDDPDRDLRHAVGTSRTKHLALSDDPHLLTIAKTSISATLDQLTARRVELKAATATLVREGFADPTVAAERLSRAREHRRYLSVGVRVNAADWDNLGTVITVDDHTGRSHVEFISADRRRRVRRWMDWADTRPVDHPEPLDIPVEAVHHFERAQQALADADKLWAGQLQDRYGADVEELHVVDAAIDLRRQRLTHRLTGHPPDWLTWWYGPRPADPAGAQVWDDELTRLATWRDTHHLGDHTPGYGPPPDNPTDARRWAEHTDRALRVRGWLHHHTPNLPTPTPRPVDIAAVRTRLHELDAVLAAAPPDQRHIVTDLTTGRLNAADIHQALLDAADTQHARRTWILEHWPHVVEHAELTRISNQHPPLAHWPAPVPEHLQRLLEHLAAHSVDTPEARTLTDIDRAAAQHNPWQIRDRLNDERDDLQATRRDLHAHLDPADRAQSGIVRQHLDRIHQRLHEIDQELSSHGARVALWNLGRRPPDLAEAARRRANHLAHHAIHNRDPWVINLLNTAQRHQPNRPLHALAATIAEVAAHRERIDHTGPDPLGPQPPVQHPHRAQWQRLHANIHGRGLTIATTLSR